MMRAWLYSRRGLLAICVLIVVGTVGLNRWHTPQDTDPVDTALGVVLATMAASYLLFMIATRDEWTAASLGIFALLLGDLLLWGGLVVATRAGLLTGQADAMRNGLRACFFAAGVILLFDLLRWAKARWGRRMPTTGRARRMRTHWRLALGIAAVAAVVGYALAVG